MPNLRLRAAGAVILPTALALAAGCRSRPAGLTITVRADDGATAARAQVSRTAGPGLVSVGDADGAGRVASTVPGSYWARSAGAGGTGELVRVAFTGGRVDVVAAVRVPVLDAPRAARSDFTPGASLALEARDAAGLEYRLLVPRDAFAAPTTLTLTPLAHALLANAAGDGVTLVATTPSRRPLYLEVTGGDAAALLVTYDDRAGRWQPVAGTVDDAGVRFHQLAPAARAVYSEVAPLLAPAPPIARGAVPLDEAAYARLAGDVRAALAWIAHRHPDGGPLDEDEQAIVDMAADAMRGLANTLADRACVDGPDVGALQLAATALRSAQLLGAPADDGDRLPAMVRRCVSQVLRQTDCQAARTGGDVVAIELARQQLAQARRIVAGVGDDALARDLAGELADALVACTPGSCDAGADLHQPAVAPRGLEPIGVDHCGAGCGRRCATTSSEDLCHDEVDQGPRWNLEQCRGSCELEQACGFELRITPAAGGLCTYTCTCRGGPLAAGPCP